MKTVMNPLRTRSSRLGWLALAAIGFFFSVEAMPAAAATGAGTTAANFLKIGVGARGAAMGEAHSAVANDVTSLHWNPAGLADMRFKEASVMHYSLVESIRYDQASFGLPTPQYGHFAFGINRLDYGDIQGYDAGALPTGKVTAKNLLLTGSWAKMLSPKSKLAGGVSVKYLQSDLAGYSATAPMLDLGLKLPFETGKFRGLSLAANVRNLGPDIEYDAQGSALPQQTVVGAGYQAFGGNLILAADFIQPRAGDSYLAAGLEYRVFELLNLRVGYNGISEFVGNGITYGMGLQFKQWNLDYAFVPFGDLGDTSRVSVGIRFGKALSLERAEDQVEGAYRRAQQLVALGKGVEAYSTLSELLQIAPWHKPSVELKAKIEKQFTEMAESRDRARMEAQIADLFTDAKEHFDRDNLVEAKKGFETILHLQPDHVGSKVYLERIQNRYASLAHEAFKEGMGYFAAGDYATAIQSFEKTLTIDPEHADAAAQLEKTRQIMVDERARAEEMRRLAGAEQAYKDGLAAYQRNNLEAALTKFTEVQSLAPEYEEVGRYLTLTKQTLAGVLFEQAQVHLDNGQLREGVAKLTRAAELLPEDDRIRGSLAVAERDLMIKKAQDSKQLYKEGLEAYLGGDTAKAEKKWREALELDSSNEDALKAISKLEEQKRYGNSAPKQP